ncbi:MAG TPA: Ig-like domain-containing protein [Sporichthyaceae bacterium]|jgi:lipoprotein-anchoring transpeptidase ErfK/SrfK
MHGRSKRQRVVRAGTGAAAAVLLLAACGSGGGAAITAGAAPPPVPANVKLTVSPAPGAQNVLTDTQPALSVAGGTFDQVSLSDAKGRTVSGALAASRSAWRASGPLTPGRSYSLESTGTDAGGHPFHNTTTFSTVDPDQILKAYVSPLAGMTVGVGQPIAVSFSHPVADRVAVERQLVVDTTPQVYGAWHWMSDDVVHWRPQTYWPANTKVVLHTNLKDVALGDGQVGDADRTIPFTVGREQISYVDVKTHKMTVFRDGKLVRTIAVSTGKPGFITRGGKKVVLGLTRVKEMKGESIGISKTDPDYFDLKVQYAVRVTWSGEFLHAAPWQGRNHGRANVSHGCVGMGTADGRWFFDHTIVGDVVDVSHSKRKMELRNGYGDWNMSWDKWLAGSALPQPSMDAGSAEVGQTTTDAVPQPGQGTPLSDHTTGQKQPSAVTRD